MDSDKEWSPDEDDMDEDEDDVSLDEQEQLDDDEEQADALEQDLFGARLDPFTLLEGMGAQGQGDETAPVLQPYEILARTAMQARSAQAGPSGLPDTGPGEQEDGANLKRKRGKKGKAVFGATVENIWDDDMEQFDLALGLSSKGRKRLRGRQKRRRKAQAAGKRTRDLPEEVTRLLGEANMLYVTGKHQDAINVFTEVIKQAPNLSDPYQTLGLLHEAEDNPRKALDFYMIAAHMNPKDVEIWRRLARLSGQMGFVRQAIYCLTKVIARDKEDLDARWERALFFMELEEHKKAAAAFEQIRGMRPGDGEVVKTLVRLYHHLRQPDKAVELLEGHLKEYPLATDLTHVNILAELHLEAGRFADALRVIEATGKGLSRDEELPLDLQAKAGICQLHLGQTEAAMAMLDKLAAVDEEDDFDDLLMDAADALLETGHAEKALALYKRVRPGEVARDKLYGKMAACNVQLGRMAGALDVYRQILADESMAPESKREAAMSMAEAFETGGQKDEALRALQAVDEFGPLDLELTGRKTQMLLRLGDVEGYLETIIPVVDASLKKASTGARTDPKQAKLVAQAKRRRQTKDRQQDKAEQNSVFKGYVTSKRGQRSVAAAAERAGSQAGTEALPQPEAEGPDAREETVPAPLLLNLGKDPAQFDTIVQVARVLMRSGRPLKAAEIVSGCVTNLTRRTTDRSKKDTLRVLAAEAALAAGEPALATYHLRFVLENWPHSTPVWNLFCEAAARLGTLKHVQKTAAQLRQSVHDCTALKLVHGHCLAFGNALGRAVSEYTAAYESQPEAPLTLLCLAVAHLSQATSRRVPDRDRAVLAAFCFLQNYGRQRGNRQEVLYNFGRAAHQLGLMHLAVPWYQQALAEEPPPPAQRPQRETLPGEAIDLRREIAHNLALIYRSSGADGLAHQLMRTHLVV